MPNDFDPQAPAAPDAGIFGLDVVPEDAGVVLIPVPFDVTASFGEGANEGPSAILEASHQLDLFDPILGRPYEAGICMLDEDPEIIGLDAQASALAGPIHDAGGVETEPEFVKDARLVDELMVRLHDKVYSEACRWLDMDKLVGVVGGDHSVPFGLMRALAKRHPDMGVLQIDAHCDLRVAYEGFTWSHASIMHNLLDRLPGVSRLVQVGIRDFSEEEHKRIEQSAGRIQGFYDHVLQSGRLEGRPWSEQIAPMVEALPNTVYVSLDIDGLDPALCPHTGTPVPGGLSFAELDALLGAVVRSGRKLVGFDLCEVAPGPNDVASWDANLGMRVLYKLIGWSLRSEATI